MPEIDERAEIYCENNPTDLDLRIMSFSAMFAVDLTEELSLTAIGAYRDRTFKQESRNLSRLTAKPAARRNALRKIRTATARNCACLM